MLKWREYSEKAKGRVQAAVATATVAGAAAVSVLSEWGINVCGG